YQIEVPIADVGQAQSEVCPVFTAAERLFGLFAGSVIGTDEQVADDGAGVIAQGGNRDDGGKAAAVFAHLGQFVDVFHAARGFEDEGFEAGGDGGIQFEAEGFGAVDDFLGIGDVSGRELADYIDGRVAQHALGTHVEQLNGAFLIGPRFHMDAGADGNGFVQ